MRSEKKYELILRVEPTGPFMVLGYYRGLNSSVEIRESYYNYTRPMKSFEFKFEIVNF